MRTSRVTKRDSRRRNAVPSVAIAGYTNAGKSSLLNRLTGAGVLVEDALFATLDPTVRRAVTPDGRQFTLTDTVGFVRHLPHQLVEAFRSTLEEVADADLLLHVVDATNPDPRGAAAGRPARCSPRSARARFPSWSWSTRPTRPTPTSSGAWCAPSRARWRSRRAPARASTGCSKRSADRLPRPQVEVEVARPLSPG